MENTLNNPEVLAQLEQIYNSANAETPVAEQPQQQQVGTSIQEPTASNPVSPATQPTTNQTAPVNGEQPPVAAPTNNGDGGLILGKFKTPDEAFNAYSNLESFNTQTRQELSQVKQTNEQLMAAVEQMKQKLVNSQAPQDATSTANNGEADNQEDKNAKFMDKFYEDPINISSDTAINAVTPLIEQLKAQIAPLIEQQKQAAEQKQWSDSVQQFATVHPDIANYKGSMAEILKDPDIANNPKALDIAYGMAKGQNYKNPDEYLSDDSFVNDKIMNNKAITDKIIQNYLNGVRQNNQAPQVIGNNSSGQVPLTPATRPQNMDEAEAMVRKLFGN